MSNERAPSGALFRFFLVFLFASRKSREKVQALKLWVVREHAQPEAHRVRHDTASTVATAYAVWPKIRLAAPEKKKQTSNPVNTKQRGDEPGMAAAC